jgi:hypothetical protein
VPTLSAYEYAYLRVTPHVERGEFLNVGVLLYCRTKRYLGVRILLDEARLAAFAPALDLSAVRAHLALIPRICAGEGPIGKLGQAEAFHWLVHPHSTVLQTSKVHTGLCEDPAEALERLSKALSDL